ncbi:MAG: O-antigen ligase family protein [Alphaproteobacteria bacterium]|nr:O-antigen ligase family protein [Alphaproteobacteria bacterium]
MMQDSITLKQLPERRAIVFVTFSTLIMAFSSLFSLIPILIFYAIWLPHILYGKTFVLRPSFPLVFMGLFPLICLFTLFWSDYRGETIHKGLEFASMVVCSAIVARIVPPTAFVKGLSLGVSIVMLITFLTGHSHTIGGTDEAAITGLFGSKNVVGLFATIGLFSAVSFLCTKSGKIEKIVYTALPLALCLLGLVLSRSASSLVVAFAVIAALIMAGIVSKFPRGLRPVILGLLAFAAATFGFSLYAFQIDLYAEILHALGKNPTLTGRTYLWEEGIRLGSSNPFLGHGYAAFWVHGQPDAERLWKEFYIDNRTGFHFHNLLIETFVETGMIGVLILASLILITLFYALWNCVANGISIKNAIMFCIALMFAIRAFVEVDLLGPFGIGPFLFYSTYLYLFPVAVNNDTKQAQ